MKITPSSGRHHYVAVVSISLIFLIMAASIVGMAGCGGGPIKIYTWFDLDKVRDDLGGSYILMNDLDSTTANYFSLASATANDGKGWDPIGSSDEFFIGHFDGQGYEIRDMVINRPARDNIGPFGVVRCGVVEHLGVVNATVTGHNYVGGLVGWNKEGTVSNCYVTGSVNGEWDPFREELAVGCGGLVGWNEEGTVSDSYSTGNVTAYLRVGGLVGWNVGPVSNSYSRSNVTGGEEVGGLVGHNWWGGVSDSYSTGNVTGYIAVGGLVGYCWWAKMDNSHYNYDEVLINGQNVITIGALSDEDFEEWMANDKFLDVNERLSQEDGYYAINNISDFKQLLAFGQDGSLKFRLKNDLDLATEPNFYIPYLAGEFDGDGHKISNLSVNFDFLFGVGLFGYLYLFGDVSDVGAENVNITGDWTVGGLVGYSEGTVSNSYSTGSVRGHEWEVGGLVGYNWGDVINSYSSSDVRGRFDVGGLVGRNCWGIVDNCYSTGSVTGGYDYTGGLVGWNEEGTVSNCYATGNVTGEKYVGGLVGYNEDTVSDSYSTGNVSGHNYVGGLVGDNGGTVSSSFWDTETSGQATSDGGTGKNTMEMKNIATFSGVGWNITAVANPSTRDPSCIWNIVDYETYPFLSWQSVV